MEPVSEEPLAPHEALQKAGELIDEGRPFAAHEVLEARWKAAPSEEGDLWQGLAQLCVALTHAARGNKVGAERLYERAGDRLAAFASTGRGTYGVDVTAAARHARHHECTFWPFTTPLAFRPVVPLKSIVATRPSGGAMTQVPAKHAGRQ